MKMNLQAHLSGQISGQVPNQPVMQLPGLQSQNKNSLSAQVQNLGHHNTSNVQPYFGKERMFMQRKILDFLMQRQQHTHEIPRKSFLDLVRCLEDGLFKTAASKEEYINLETLENRLRVLIKRVSLSNHSAEFQGHDISSFSVAAMVATSGMPPTGKPTVNTPMVASSGFNGITSTIVNMGNFLPINNGLLSNEYPLSSFYISSGGNGIMSSSGVQRMTSHMIPSSAFNCNNNDNDNNESHKHLDSCHYGGRFSSVESMMLSPEQKEKFVGQNSVILQNLGGHMSDGIGSGFQQKSYGFSNGTLVGHGTSEVLETTLCGNSTKPLQQHHNQDQQPLMWIDEDRMSTTDSSAFGNFNVPVSSTASMINFWNSHLGNLQSIPKTNSPFMTNQSNLRSAQQATRMEPQPNHQLEKMYFQSRHIPCENAEHALQQQQIQVQSHGFQKQLVQYQCHQKQQIQLNPLLNNDAFSASQLTSNTDGQIEPDPAVEWQDEALNSQVTGEFQLFDMQNSFQRNSGEDHFESTQFLSLPSGSQDFCLPLSQTSQQMQQLLHLDFLCGDPQNDFSCFPIGSQSQAVLHDPRHLNSEYGSPTLGNLSYEQNVQEEFHTRITTQNGSQQNNLSSEGSNSGQTLATRRPEPTNSSIAMRRSGNLNYDWQIMYIKKWLLFLIHARGCSSSERKCRYKCCVHAQELLRHIKQCSVAQCSYPRCPRIRVLLNHFKHCGNPVCPICVPVRNFIWARQHKACNPTASHSDTMSSVNGSSKSHGMGVAEGGLTSMTGSSDVETLEDLQSAPKRMKIGQTSQSLVFENESSIIPGPPSSEPYAFPNVQHVEHQHCNTCMPGKSEVTQINLETSFSVGQIVDMNKHNMDDNHAQRSNRDAIVMNDAAGFAKQGSNRIDKETGQAKKGNANLPAVNAGGTKSRKPKIEGVSLTELFNAQQVREHIVSLRKWIGQRKAKAEKNQAMSESSCQLCAVDKLTFEPPPIYCTPCGARIKRNAMYYTIGAGDTRHCFCIPCYNVTREDCIVVDRTPILKARLVKKKNDEEIEEWWVQCDKCEGWQHQICALFNGRRNDGGQAEYTCPNCYVAEVERGERKPLPQNAVLGAMDLPTTLLSDHMERRLYRRLKEEREERARLQGKSFDEVPGAEALVIRVVSSVDKKLEVRSRFLEIFQEQNYPSEFPYKSKVILLFQKIEGVEVCLFGMYVQEFGSDCQQPNDRQVYLSYLDSVKYFRPEVKTVTGEALRTFVYQEILIGYLEYCKLRGFTSCYIWACPPLKGEDYILYCHPEIQKVPKSDKLREWYLSMLRKAVKETIVVGLTNLYDHFFVSVGECKAKVTAARLPYFEGDYWPGAAEDMLYQIQQEEDGRKQHKKGTTKMTIKKRAVKLNGQTDLSGNVSQDLLLMRKLGETIRPMKEDFIMVHLQHACSHCCILMVSGNRWVCNQCKNFHLCDKCYEAEQKLDEGGRHPINQIHKHILHPVGINNVPDDTKDSDEILESEFFDTRQAFLSLCQVNHYQYNTLRHAKHSSMMVLYHLHNPPTAFVTTCNVCHLDIEASEGWHCEVCTDYEVCNTCYQKNGEIDHPHKLINHPSVVDHNAQKKEARQLRVLQLRKMLDLLMHASLCDSVNCQHPNCWRVKQLFRHGMQCKTRASGGCALCKNMWTILHLHARACRQSECHVPRCRDLKEHSRRLQQQSESRQRAAVMDMMRQRAAEVASNNAA